MNEPTGYPPFDYESYRRRNRIFAHLRSDRVWVNVLLFLLTIASTYFVSQSVVYVVSIMGILFCHEMGHYVTARRYGIRATLPYFIPMPLPPFGTLGAVIRMEHVVPNRKALFDVGVAGPLAGLVVALPITIYGLAHSPIVPLNGMAEGTLQLGDSLLFKFLSYLVVGPVPKGYDVVLHPAAYAGWVGLLVTALNLLPVGQLDGGHVVYAMLGGQKSRLVFYLALVGFAVILVFFYWGWVLMVIFIVLFALKHPPPMDDWTPIGKKRVILGIVVMVIFFLSFTPVPFKI